MKHERRRGPGRLGNADLDDDLLSEGGTTVVSGEARRLQADGRGGLDPKKKRGMGFRFRLGLTVDVERKRKRREEGAAVAGCERKEKRGMGGG